jgi:sugar fermentation stimulation protein A
MQPLFFYPWPRALVEGRLVRRYNRFLTDVTLGDGRRVTAHCANSGAMEGLIRPGARVWLSSSEGARRTLPWTWSMVEVDGVRVGVDTLLPNRLVRAMLEARALPRMGPYDAVQPEFPHATGSRVDFRLQGGDTPHDLEVKNCHLVYPDGRGYFPDGVSVRATKHLVTLAREVQRGFRASVLFLVQREDVKAVRPSDLHDPAFAEAARKAARAGVRFRALRARPDVDGVAVLGSIPVDLGDYSLTRVARWRDDLRPFSGWDRPPRKA